MAGIIFSRLRNFSIEAQLRYGLVSLVVSSLLVAGGILIQLSSQSQLKESQLLQQERSQKAATKIENYLDNLQSQLVYLAKVRGLTNLSPQAQRQLLEGLTRHSNTYETVAIINKTGEIVVAVSPYENQPSLTKNSVSSVFEKTFKQSANYIGSVEINPLNKIPITIIAVPIRNQQDRVDGILLAKVNLQFLDIIVSQTNVGKTGYTYVIDNRNIIIAKKRTPAEAFRPYVLEDISEREFIRQLKTNETKPLSIYEGLRNVEVLGASSRIYSVNWSVIVELPTAEAYAPVRTLILTMAVALLFLTIIAILLGFFLAKRIVSPLRSLTTAAAHISEGNLNIKLNIQSPKELGVLANTFNTMAAQLAEFYRSLEQKVAERTNELKNANLALESEIVERKQAEADLQHTLHELKKTQIQLIQSEKMSSLGQLVAGVAHEINNPVNFIHGNIEYITNYTHDLLSLVNLYQQCYPQIDPEIEQKIEAIELDFLIEDLPKILSSMSMGTERIRQIVLSLRTFSRLDEAEMKEVNIHEGIDSTLMILQSQLKNKADRPGIQIVKEYGKLPLVECYPGQLNQVFMNIINNAIDALEERDKKRSLRAGDLLTSEAGQQNTSTIRICTDMVNSQTVRIRIIDNGIGMPEDVQSRLFDPFFTTKPVGKGTGLGLSISYQIVTEKHQGSLQCISSLGKGTEFLIEIPIKQS